MNPLLRKIVFPLFFLAAIPWLAWSGESSVVQEIRKEERVGCTRLLLDFSALPPFQVEANGQRVDLYFKNTTVSPKLRQLPEDDAIVKVLIAQKRKDCIFSFLLRKLPARIQTIADRDKGGLAVDLYWEKAGPRPAVDMRSFGHPLRKPDGSVTWTLKKSPYAGDWKNFFRDYRIPLEIKLPLVFTVPEPPPFPKELLGAESRPFHDRIQSGDWPRLEGWSREMAKMNPGTPGIEVYQTLYLEYLVRFGVENKPPEGFPNRVTDQRLASRFNYWRNFLEARSNPHLARIWVAESLSGMEPDNPYRPYLALLEAEISLVLGSPEDASRRLLDQKTRWPETLLGIRSLRLLDSGAPLLREETVAAPASATALPIEREAPLREPTAPLPQQAKEQEQRPRQLPANPEESLREPEVQPVQEPEFLLAEVRRGDSWWKLSRKYKTTVAALKKINNAENDLLFPGQMIRIPRQPVVPAAPPKKDLLTAQAAETVSQPAPPPPTAIPDAEPTLAPSAPAPAPVPPAQPKPYTYALFLEEKPALLFGRPFSLYRAVREFQKEGNPAAALALIPWLRPQVKNPEALHLIGFLEAELLFAVDRRLDGFEILNGLAEEHPNSEGGCRARMKLLDLQFLDPNYNSDLLYLALQYGQIATEVFLRGLKEEGFFKQALALYMGGEKGEAIALLRKFRKDFSNGDLADEARDFLAEILPSYLVELIKEGRDFDTAVMLDQNRELLLAGDIGKKFLLRLADALSRIQLEERSSRIYLYLLDLYQNRPEEKDLYLPLAQGYFNRGEFAAAEDFAGRYLSKFPQGKDRSEAFYLLMAARSQTGKEREALALWRDAPRPVSPEACFLAARLFWKQGDRQGVLAALKALPDQEKLPPEVAFMKAESLFEQGKAESSRQLYQELAAETVYQDASWYRLGQISLSRGRDNEALNYFRKITEKEGEQGLWKRLAAESIRELEMRM